MYKFIEGYELSYFSLILVIFWVSDLFFVVYIFVLFNVFLVKNVYCICSKNIVKVFFKVL